MRYLTYFTSTNNRIDIHNSLFSGQEKVFYNGKLVAAQCTLWGARHRFNVVEDEENVEYEVVVSIKPLLRIGFDIFRNGKALLLS